jgi:hypothetical protein
VIFLHLLWHIVRFYSAKDRMCSPSLIWQHSFSGSLTKPVVFSLVKHQYLSLWIKNFQWVAFLSPCIWPSWASMMSKIWSLVTCSPSLPQTHLPWGCFSSCFSHMLNFSSLPMKTVVILSSNALTWFLRHTQTVIFVCTCMYALLHMEEWVWHLGTLRALLMQTQMLSAHGLQVSNPCIRICQG